LCLESCEHQISMGKLGGWVAAQEKEKCGGACFCAGTLLLAHTLSAGVVVVYKG